MKLLLTGVLFFLNLQTFIKTSRILQGRIINGTPARLGQFPWFVSLKIGARNCGGSLIAPKWVLNAAHCLNNNPSQVNCFFGSINKWQGTKLISKTYIKHPSYETPSHKNDIALIKLPKEVTYTDNIKAVLLPLDWMTYAKLMKVIAEFAAMGSFQINQESRILRYTHLKIAPKFECKGRTGISADKICAVPVVADQRSYRGDSGSGLVYEFSGEKYIIGVNSHRPLQSSTHAIFQSVLIHKEWIQKIMRES